jgi:hypothetical protein
MSRNARACGRQRKQEERKGRKWMEKSDGSLKMRAAREFGKWAKK